MTGGMKVNGQDLGDRFGGRPLTQTEYDAAVRIEKKRIRWFWILMLPVVAMLACPFSFITVYVNW